ncbi:unnamed protein product [Pieris brassicae]|uniref:Uncharacterized protein n=1 Tax=Pieris brassicae TaxID=7116 RepID=A0A9P0TDQ1_PIEBR|nr:unnamed protein product [Pieris brassicae]
MGWEPPADQSARSMDFVRTCGPCGPSLGFPRVYRGSHPVWSDRDECCESEDALQQLRDLGPLQAQHKDHPAVERGANRYPPQANGLNGAPGASRGFKRGRK